MFVTSSQIPDRRVPRIRRQALVPACAALLVCCTALHAADMAFIPDGSFQMGDSLGDGDAYELPVHTVRVSAFYMDRDLITNDEMADILNWAYGQGKLTLTAEAVHNAEGDSRLLLDLDDPDCRIVWTGSSFELRALKATNYPCITVSWFGAAAYCNYKTLKDGGGLTPCYNLTNWSCNWSASGYRLPTEAEWEKAARGGWTGRRFAWGDTINHSNANYVAEYGSFTYETTSYGGPTLHPDYDDGGSPYTSPIDAFPANDYGLLDMGGNVKQWCWDRYTNDYYSTSPPTDPRGPAAGANHVVRGGAYFNDAGHCRASARAQFGPDKGYVNVGFRTARNVVDAWQDEIQVVTFDSERKLIFNRVSSGLVYRVESVAELPGTWYALTNQVTVDGELTTLDAIPAGSGNVTCTVPVTGDAQFYRVVGGTSD